MTAGARPAKAALLPVAGLVLWEVAMRVNDVQSDSLAPPSAIAAAFAKALIDGTIATRTWETLQAAVIGLAIGGGAAVIGSAILGLVPLLARLMLVTIEVLRPIPTVALIPLALLVFGFGIAMEAALVAKSCFWPILIYGVAAIRSIEPRLLEVGRTLRLSPVAIVTKIVLPAALPRYFVAFRLAAAVALIIAVTTEITTNPIGIGAELMLAAQSLHPDLMFAMLLWLGIVGWSLNAFLLFLQRRLFGAMSTTTELAR
ncbi:MAG: ABC transporter permease [Rhodospirillaceae bacterium]